MFVSTRDGDVPIGRVISAIVRRNDVSITYADGVGNSNTTASTSAWQTALQSYAVQMMPAAPGTYTLTYDRIDGKEVVWRANVIAWAATAEGLIYPVTVDGINAGTQQNFAILHPDGRVDVPEDRSFESYEEWLNECAGEQ